MTRTPHSSRPRSSANSLRERGRAGSADAAALSSSVEKSVKSLSGMTGGAPEEELDDRRVREGVAGDGLDVLKFLFEAASPLNRSSGASATTAQTSRSTESGAGRRRRARWRERPRSDGAPLGLHEAEDVSGVVGAAHDASSSTVISTPAMRCSSSTIGVLRLRARLDLADALEDVRLDLGELRVVDLAALELASAPRAVARAGAPDRSSRGRQSSRPCRERTGCR